jgi:hypothetical protein
LSLWRRIGGWTLIFVGLAGCVLPIIPGLPILAVGVAIVGVDHPLIRPFRDWLHQKGLWPVKKKEPS